MDGVELIVTAEAEASEGRLSVAGRVLRCALGRAGIATATREGDGATPVGVFALRRLLYRPDRLIRPRTGLSISPIRPDDGWCDAPEDPDYNRPVQLPHEASAEAMWRRDRLYDLVVVLGHNDDPVVPGHGSAVFLHVARPDFGPTAGCVALASEDLLEVLALVGPDGRLRVVDPSEIAQ